MRIEIWSDVVCPFCFLGKRRLESALADFPHADEVEVVWRSFQLDPTAPTVVQETVAEHLGSVYGGGVEAGRQMIERTQEMAAAEGLDFRHGEAPWVGTLDAHRLLHLALDSSPDPAPAGETVQQRLKESLLAAYFLHARNVADPSVLLDVAVSAGLDPGRVAEVLASDEYAEEVAADVAQAAAYGASGVPFFVVDQRYGVSGAQPTETFRQVLEQAWAVAHPTPDPATPGADRFADPSRVG